MHRLVTDRRRLVTLTGAGGMEPARLAAQLAARSASDSVAAVRVWR